MLCCKEKADWKWGNKNKAATVTSSWLWDFIVCLELYCGWVFTFVSLNIPEGVMFTDYVKQINIKRDQGQNSIFRSNRHNKEPVNRNGNRHSVSARGTAYHEQPQRIRNRYSILATGTVFLTSWEGLGHSVARSTENQDSHKAFREEIQDGEQSLGGRQLIS